MPLLSLTPSELSQSYGLDHPHLRPLPQVQVSCEGKQWWVGGKWERQVRKIQGPADCTVKAKGKRTQGTTKKRRERLRPQRPPRQEAQEPFRCAPRSRWRPTPPTPNSATLSSLSIGEERCQSAMPANQPARRGPGGGAAAWPRRRVLRGCRKR